MDTESLEQNEYTTQQQIGRDVDASLPVSAFS